MARRRARTPRKLQQPCLSLIAHPSTLCRCLRCLSMPAPFLPRHYPPQSSARALEGLEHQRAGCMELHRRKKIGVWVCGPNLTLAKGGKSDSLPYVIGEEGLDYKQMPNCHLLLKFGPRSRPGNGCYQGGGASTKNQCVHHKREFLKLCARSYGAGLRGVSGTVLGRRLTKLCNISAPPIVIMFRVQRFRQREGSMILKMNDSFRIDNLRRCPSEMVEALRSALVAGVIAAADPRRKNFYDLEAGDNIFYIHVSPTGTVLLLACWRKEPAERTIRRQAPLPEARAYF